jgi:hypothetical protein
MGWTAGVRLPSGASFFLYPTASKLALGPTQLHIRLILGALSPGIKWPGHEADHSRASSAEFKNGVAIPALRHMSSWHKIYLIKHRDNFTSTFF